jgi:hypothetical protein
VINAITQLTGNSNLYFTIQILWTRYIQPLARPGNIPAILGLVAAVAVGVILLVIVPSRVAHRFITKPLGIFSVQFLTVVVQIVVTLLDVLLIGLGLYAGYWLGLLPRSAASDIFVASLGATALKLAIAGGILIGKGIVSGIASYFGYQATKKAVESRQNGPNANGDY